MFPSLLCEEAHFKIIYVRTKTQPILNIQTEQYICYLKIVRFIVFWPPLYIYIYTLYIHIVKLMGYQQGEIRVTTD